MMTSLNRVMLIGNLGQDPETRQAGNGRVCSLRIATSESWRDKQSGERQERTEWHSVTIFDDQKIDFASNNLRKGAQVFVEGKLETRKWKDQSGHERQAIEIIIRPYRGELILLGSREAPSGTAGQRAQSGRSQKSEPDFGDFGSFTP